MKVHVRITIESLLGCGVSHRQIERRAGVDRKTIRRYATASKSPGVATGLDGAPEQTPPPRPPAPPGGVASSPTGASACKSHRTWIESQLRPGRNVQSLY